MILRIHPQTPEPRKIEQVAQILKQGGVVVYPTDSVYALGCDLNNHKAIEALCKLKGVKPEKANFSIVCESLSHISDYTKPIENGVFRMMKRCLPGPYTFILEANNNTPKIFRLDKKREIGIRVPNNMITRKIIEFLGNPMVTTSIHDEDEIMGYTTDPEAIADRYEKRVDLIVDGGMGKIEPSTIVNCIGEPFIQRQGLGHLEL